MPRVPLKKALVGWERSYYVEHVAPDHMYQEGTIVGVCSTQGSTDKKVEIFLREDELDYFILALIESKTWMSGYGS